MTHSSLKTSSSKVDRLHGAGGGSNVVSTRTASAVTSHPVLPGTPFKNPSLQVLVHEWHTKKALQADKQLLHETARSHSTKRHGVGSPHWATSWGERRVAGTRPTLLAETAAPRRRVTLYNGALGTVCEGSGGVPWPFRLLRHSPNNPEVHPSPEEASAQVRGPHTSCWRSSAALAAERQGPSRCVLPTCCQLTPLCMRPQ